MVHAKYFRRKYAQLLSILKQIRDFEKCRTPWLWITGCGVALRVGQLHLFQCVHQMNIWHVSALTQRVASLENWRVMPEQCLTDLHTGVSPEPQTPFDPRATFAPVALRPLHLLDPGLNDPCGQVPGSNFSWWVGSPFSLAELRAPQLSWSPRGWWVAGQNSVSLVLVCVSGRYYRFQLQDFLKNYSESLLMMFYLLDTLHTDRFVWFYTAAGFYVLFEAQNACQAYWLCETPVLVLLLHVLDANVF